MTPWQGSGASQAIEDTMILRTLLASIRVPEQLDASLSAYDEVRRPRTQRIVESSRITGMIMSGRGEGIGVHTEKMRQGLKERWEFIYDLDIERHKEDALAALKRIESGVEVLQ